MSSKKCGCALLEERDTMTRVTEKDVTAMNSTSYFSFTLTKVLALSCILCTHGGYGFAFLPSATYLAPGGGRQQQQQPQLQRSAAATGYGVAVIRRTHVCSAGIDISRVVGRETTALCASSPQNIRGKPQQKQKRRSRRLHMCTSAAAASADIDLADDLNTLSGDRGSEEGVSDDVDKEIEVGEELGEEDLLAAAIRQAGFLDGSSRGQMLDVEKILAETEYLEVDNVPEGFRCGFVTIMGSPNVGKSTLMNSMIGDRLSIVTPKAGTTRHRISGIMTGDDFQIIYQDTPGVLNPVYMLHEGMMNFVQEAMGDADCILLMTDIFEKEFPSATIFEKMLETGKPIVVAVNKVDLLPSDGRQEDGNARQGGLSAKRLKEVGSLQDVLAMWEERLPGAQVLPISALERINTHKLAERLKDHIPEGPPLFGEDVMSDKPQRFFAAEIIREQIFCSFSQEIPYSCEVLLDGFKERKSETVLDATIVVAQESQKGMVIGKGGAKIKDVGIKARIALEDYFQKRVNLRLNVKVDKNWRKNKNSLKAYGYIR